MASRAPLLLLLQTLLLVLALAWSVESVNGSGEETEGGALTEAGQPLEHATQWSFVRRRLVESQSGGGFNIPCSVLNCQRRNQTCCPVLRSRFNVCKDTKTDNDNCGGCGKECPSSKPVCCAGVCTNILRDTNNCGKCGRKCSKCVFGFCGGYNGKD